MPKLSKLQRSQNAHERLFEFYRKKSSSTSSDTPESFYSSVKRRYHMWIYNSQKENNKISTLKSKKETYKESLHKEISDRKYENSLGAFSNWYIPNKYNK